MTVATSAGAPARRGVWRRAAKQMFVRAMDQNVDVLRAAIEEAVADLAAPRILDLGCWDGSTTARYVPARAHVHGVEADAEAGAVATARGFEVQRGDLNEPLHHDDATFDAVVSNQVFEHLHDTDRFISEARRVLRPGGLLAVSTENLASWHNVGALALGWQAFSLTNVSTTTAGLGNPLANLRGASAFDAGWQHQRIFSYQGLLELGRRHALTDVRVRGAGYYPLPRHLARLDPRHAAFITLIGRKPAS